MPGFAENFIAGIQAGQQRKRQEQDFTDAQEERGIRKMLLDLEMRKHKIDEAIQKRELAKGNVDLMQGQPFGDLSRPVNEGESGGYDLANFKPEQGIPQQRVIDPVSIPGVDELGVPGVNVKPRSMEDLIGAQTQAKYRDAAFQKVAPGEVIPAFGDTPPAGPRQEPRQPSKSLEQEWLDATEAGDTNKARLIERALNLRDQNMSGKGSETNSALVGAVLENPELYDRLTAKQIGEIAPALNAAGFKGFGKTLTEGAITKIAESKSAVASLRDLRQTLLDNEQYIGPVAGLQALNPYSDARKAQAKIDLVKQRVGKALEGGVLRKEDEDKYKKILATLRDEPSTAISKVDSIIETLERDLETFVESQRSAGRRVNETKPTTSKKVGRFEIVAD
jgi:hypothetical protein